jgi:aminobenzoyl-glutamate utilization protein A
MYKCTHSIEVTGGSESGESSQEMIDLVYEAAQDVPFYNNIIKLKDLGGGEDYAHMMSEVQKAGGVGTYMQVGVNIAAGHHNNRFDLDEADLLPATELLSYVMYKVLKK